jgi:uncharacterized protein
VKGLLTVTLILAAVLAVLAAGTPVPPAPARWCTDEAGFLSGAALASADAQLEAYERQTGRQVIVYIGGTTGGVPIEEWAVRAFEAWGVGKKGKDDGAALFIFSQDQALRIEVGYGLEGDLPDAVANRIIQEVVIPRIRAGDRDGAVLAGVSAILRAASGEPWQGAGTEAASGGPSGPTVTTTGTPMKTWHVVVIVIVGIAFLILLITHPSLALWLLFQILSAAVGGGGGGGGGGGFSGGGGRSGGGGASGRW